MHVIKVTDNCSVNEFHQLPYAIYKNDPNWIPMLNVVLEDIFNAKKNARFTIGDACRWILKREGETIGRIAAFYDSDYASGYEQPTGCIGFFECVDSKEAAFALFDTAKKWLIDNGMEAMDGPVNFGENFFHWGLLKEGHKPQTFGMQYHAKYYLELFEDYGFKTYYDQYSYAMDIMNPDLPERFWKIAAWVAKKPGYSFKHFSFKNQDKYINDFIEIHKEAWEHHSNYKPVKFDELKGVVQSGKLLIDEEFLWYAYHNGKPVAFFMMIRDLNQVVSKFKTGKLNLWGKIKLLYLVRKNTITRCRVIVLGVVPKYQNKGVESAIFYQLKKVVLRKPWYTELEMSWVGDFNPKMNALFKSFGAAKTLTHATMRYLFDREKAFVKAPVIE